ncbi:MAG: hypothetical protein OEZ06_28940 [Myxococcales bacterium]|nr:hypothetical protein [Myxococcales bacterium]
MSTPAQDLSRARPSRVFLFVFAATLVLWATALHTPRADLHRAADDNLAGEQASSQGPS